jgi:hypothetical protein
MWAHRLSLLLSGPPIDQHKIGKAARPQSGSRPLLGQRYLVFRDKRVDDVIARGPSIAVPHHTWRHFCRPGVTEYRATRLDAVR